MIMPIIPICKITQTKNNNYNNNSQQTISEKNNDNDKNSFEFELNKLLNEQQQNELFLKR